MDPHEVTLFVLHRTQLAVGGRTRDDLPYTTEFDNLRTQYNQQSPPQQLSDYQYWGLLRYVLKYGEEHMEAYLQPLGINVPPKSRGDGGSEQRREEPEIESTMDDL
ncbi:MAG: hypothetical protein ACRDD1_11440 [Planctomycetia bacterium]